MADITGKIWNKLRNKRLSLLGFCSTLRMNIILSLKGVTKGNGLQFWGCTYVYRHPGSTIKIGATTAFRSDSNSNLIGVKGKCMLSTHSETAQLIIGENCGFSGTVLGAKEKIVIGRDVLCGANTLITDFDWHGVAPDQRRNYSGDSKEVLIGNNVFIGYGSVILKGVTIGDNSVIGANSVVTKSIPANVIAGGNPCKVLRNL